MQTRACFEVSEFIRGSDLKHEPHVIHLERTRERVYQRVNRIHPHHQLDPVTDTTLCLERLSQSLSSN